MFSRLLLLTAFVSLAACAPIDLKTEGQLRLREASFNDLPGWSADAQSGAALALQRSCAALRKKDPEATLTPGDFAGTVATWQQICADLAEAVPMTDAQARAFFESHFAPYEMASGANAEGLFTGYYEPILHGSLRHHGKYNVPIYGRPHDLVTANLGDFRPELAGQRLTARVTSEGTLVPYYDREEIEEGALAKNKAEIVWVDSAVDAFFLHIQGSGRIKLENGREVRVGYAAENGHAYTAIGKALIERGALEKDNVSMQSIRQWLEENPDEAAEVMNLNTSYIFFRELKSAAGPLDGPLGAQGVPLTPRRSLAVDKKIIPYSVPIYIDAEEPEGDANIQRLMIAQDTGGAIKGPVRGDFFWGAGAEAAHKAGLMKSKGRAWMLLPKQEAAQEDVVEEETPAPLPQINNTIADWWSAVKEKLMPPAE